MEPIVTPDTTVTPPVPSFVYSGSMTGRKKIRVSATQVDKSNIIDILQKAQAVHTRNSQEIDYLYRYYRGEQPILQRVKSVRPEINNKIIENRAAEIVDFVTGYLLSEPIKYISRGKGEKNIKNLQLLNDYMLKIGKAAQDFELAKWFSVAGTALRIVLPDKDKEPDVPFHSYVLDPRYAYKVYATDIMETPLMDVKYVTEEDGENFFSIYTKDTYFEIKKDKILKSEPHTMGALPMVEYIANEERLGAFEIVLPLLDALNNVASNRMDGVEQFIQSFLLFTNVDIDAQTFSELKAMGALKIKSIEGTSGAGSVDYITSELKQIDTQQLKDDLYMAVLTIVGMPNRNGGLSTSDTGSAVVMRDGWSAAETRAKRTELYFKDSEYRFLRLALRFAKTLKSSDIEIDDIDLQFTRRNYENILQKSQVLSTMLSLPGVHPKLAFTACGMFVDPELAFEESQKWVEEQKKTQPTPVNKPPATTTTEEKPNGFEDNTGD